MKKYLVHAILSLVVASAFMGCDDSASATNSSTSGELKTDTLVIKIKDSLVINHVDTLVIRDSVYMYDTAHVKDTVVLNHVDTLVVKDTVYTLLKNLCGNKEYDPQTHYCSRDSVMDKLACRYDFYNPEEELCDKRDGQIYKTVRIGDQTWMARNLNFRYVQSEDSSSFCYNNDGRMCEKYGRLYTWAAALDSVGVYSTTSKGCGFTRKCYLDTVVVRGLCPEGWHMPSRADWDALVENVGGIDSAGYRLKAKLGWYDRLMDSLGYQIPVNGGSDEFGFAALPAGDHFGDTDMYASVGGGAYFWSTSLMDLGDNVVGVNGSRVFEPVIFLVRRDEEEAKFHFSTARTAESVRCLKD